MCLAVVCLEGIFSQIRLYIVPQDGNSKYEWYMEIACKVVNKVCTLNLTTLWIVYNPRALQLGHEPFAHFLIPTIRLQ